ncbi:MAG: arsenate reductase (glutaredoxin) [Gammaproteobacteria bacterium]|nr:arsenate reductase (glutaredoxin) [Gammaproteobacteria bacterium]
MTTDVTLYYNPNCSKCRLSIELLEKQGQHATIVEYLNTPPDAGTLAAILDMLGMAPRELMRKHEKEYTEAGLDNPALSREQLINAMIEYPRLIERPIVIKDGKAVIGRPPERILDIL